MSQKKHTLLQNSKTLFSWFLENQRSLPWRTGEKRSPYHVWISEIMLQQTKVSVVVDYYLRWMKKYPTIKKLAAATEQEILLLWQGLGYYNRAKNILKTAKIIQRDYGGNFPKKYSQIISLQGIGEYTTGAICSIAYHQAKVLVDGNVERVICRFLGLTTEVKIIRSKKIIWKLLEEVIEKVPPQIFNESLMELGAVICLPKKPKCCDCPLTKNCCSRQQKNQDKIPYKKIKQKLIKVYSSCLLTSFRSHQKEFLILEKRIATSRLKGFWQLPTIEHHDKNLHLHKNLQTLENIFYQNYFKENNDFFMHNFDSQVSKSFQNKKINQNFQKEDFKFHLQKIKILNLKNNHIHFYTKYKIHLNVYSVKIKLTELKLNALQKEKELLNKKLFFIPMKKVHQIPLTTISKKILEQI